MANHRSIQTFSDFIMSWTCEFIFWLVFMCVCFYCWFGGMYYIACAWEKYGKNDPAFIEFGHVWWATGGGGFICLLHIAAARFWWNHRKRKKYYAMKEWAEDVQRENVRLKLEILNMK